MNLKGVIDENGLQQDDWSLTKPTFGGYGQLQVVGWSGKRWCKKIYILKCEICSQDSELFGEGYFRSSKSALVNSSQIPCGCSPHPYWSKGQYELLCSRKAREMGYTFLGFEGDRIGNKTKIRMLCEKHGEWCTGSVNHLINSSRGCPRCGTDVTTMISRKSDDIIIKSFLDSGCFHPDTKFWRSEKKSPNGKRVYWHIFCPECGEEAESQRSNLQEGFRACACSRSRQQECYINWVVDANLVAVAVKFGISSDSGRRIKSQARRSIYSVLQYLVFKFPDVASCKKAERECKKELECGILSKDEMPDGYTETTSIVNLLKIIEIYERNGGSSCAIQ